MKNNSTKKILIVGAGIAGLTAAYWLHRYGFSVEIIEKAASSEKKGYLMDFWGAGFSVAEKMGLIQKLSLQDQFLKEFIFLNQHGHEASKLLIADMRALQNNRVLTIFRQSLIDLLLESVANITLQREVSITKIEQTKNSVMVTFQNGFQKEYDYLIGADGVNSDVRKKIFNDEENALHYLGYHVAATIQTCDEKIDRSLYTYSNSGKQVTVCGLDNHKIAAFYVFQEASNKIINPLQRLKNHYEKSPWIIPRLLQDIEKAESFFCGPLTQVQLPIWHHDQVVLLGDAAYCLTLAAGQGASMAMVGAYILAKCMAKEVDTAFFEYQKIMQPGILYKQFEARKFLEGFIPSSANFLEQRDFYTRYFFKAMAKKTEIEDFLLLNFKA